MQCDRWGHVFGLDGYHHLVDGRPYFDIEVTEDLGKQRRKELPLSSRETEASGACGSRLGRCTTLFGVLAIFS